MFTCRPLILVAALVLPALGCGREGVRADAPGEAPPPPVVSELEIMTHVAVR